MPTHVRLRWSGDLLGAELGDVTGHAELAVADAGAASAIAFVDAVLRPADRPGTASPGDARRLAVADRDRLLVHVHLDRYGPAIETTLTCTDCCYRFDLHFRLDELSRHCEPAAPESASWQVGGIRFRPLTGDDELAVLGEGDPAEALLRRVSTAIDGAADPVDSRADVAAALDRVAPLVSAPIGATCPDCDTQQSVDFDIQSYLLRRILVERPSLWRSVHLIATAYGWCRDEILGLGRLERAIYVDAITQPCRARLR